jgi:uncharacterized membrane protein
VTDAGRRGRLVAPGLAALLATSGVSHFLVPRPFDAIVPPVLPFPPRTWTYASGVAELACAVLLAVPRTRRLGGWAAAALFVAVFPGNLYMTYDWRDRSVAEQALAWARLPLQVPLVVGAWRVARGRYE